MQTSAIPAYLFFRLPASRQEKRSRLLDTMEIQAIVCAGRLAVAALQAYNAERTGRTSCNLDLVTVQRHMEYLNDLIEKPEVSSALDEKAWAMIQHVIESVRNPSELTSDAVANLRRQVEFVGGTVLPIALHLQGRAFSQKSDQQVRELLHELMRANHGTIYAVANGEQIGVFRTWAETQPLVSGFKGATFKKFTFQTLKEAVEFFKQSPFPIVFVHEQPVVLGVSSTASAGDTSGGAPLAETH